MPDPERDYPASETRNSREMIPSGTVLQFPEINPRCKNCALWCPPVPANTAPVGLCAETDEFTNEDHHCDEYQAHRREQR